MHLKDMLRFIVINVLLWDEFVASKVSTLDMNALYIIYNATDGNNWDYTDVGFTSAWDFESGSDPCLNKWQGVTCASQFKITSLSLQNMNLKGTIPDNIGNLTDLKKLIFFDNQDLSGSIPATISQLSGVTYLQLTILNISGIIPSSICSMQSLVHIDISYNPRIIGSIPQCLANLTALEAIYLRCNNHTGPMLYSYPPKLKQLHLINNHLTGSVPALHEGLQRLSISGNSLAGVFPYALNPPLTALELLAIDFNSFGGTVPTVLDKHFPSLSMLRLDSNHFTGPLPDCIGSLTHLAHLSGVDNHFTGPLFSDIGNLIHLSMLLLSELYSTCLLSYSEKYCVSEYIYLG